MDVPGLGWLKDKLSRTDDISGGYQAKMGHSVAGGAGFAMALVYVLAWLIALIPMTLWRLGRRALQKGGTGGNLA